MKSPISVLLYVLCFQIQPLRGFFFFKFTVFTIGIRSDLTNSAELRQTQYNLSSIRVYIVCKSSNRFVAILTCFKINGQRSSISLGTEVLEPITLGSAHCN